MAKFPSFQISPRVSWLVEELVRVRSTKELSCLVETLPLPASPCFSQERGSKGATCMCLRDIARGEDRRIASIFTASSNLQSLKGFARAPHPVDTVLSKGSTRSHYSLLFQRTYTGLRERIYTMDRRVIYAAPQPSPKPFRTIEKVIVP